MRMMNVVARVGSDEEPGGGEKLIHIVLTKGFSSDIISGKEQAKPLSRARSGW